MVTGNLHAEIDLSSVVALLSLGSFEEEVHIFGIIDTPVQLLPARIVN